MRTKLKITEGIFPMPVLMVATYNEDGSVNVMNAAWGTMQERDTVVLNLTETHKTVQNIKARGAFTVSIADADHIVEADYFGVESGNKVADKFARSGLTASKAETVDAPVINEFPICLECRFIEYQNNEYGCGVIGKVVNVTADESVKEVMVPPTPTSVMGLGRFELTRGFKSSESFSAKAGFSFKRTAPTGTLALCSPWRVS